MGPLATVDLFNKIVLNTSAKSDSDHIHILIDNNPQIPDRTKAIVEHKESPIPYIVESANKLIKMGADFLIMACNTSHYYYNDISDKCCVPILNMIEETMKHIHDNGIKELFLFATTGTIATGIYSFYAELYNIKVYLPNSFEQQLIMDLIYNGVKNNNCKFDSNPIQNLISKICVNDKKQILLGCTELPIAIKMYDLKGAFIDPTYIIAKKAIEYAGFKTI